MEVESCKENEENEEIEDFEEFFLDFFNLFGFVGFFCYFFALAQKQTCHYTLATMPRGKRTVFLAACTVCGRRVQTIRLHRQKEGVSWKDFKIAKYCPHCRKKNGLKLKEERHSA